MNLLQLLRGLRPVSERVHKRAIDGVLLDAIESDALLALHERRPIWLTWRRWETWEKYRGTIDPEPVPTHPEPPIDWRTAVEESAAKLGWK